MGKVFLKLLNKHFPASHILQLPYKKESCAINGECLTSQLLYRAMFTNAVNEDIKKYIGLADTTFKEKHSNHKRNFKHQKYRNCTELAKYVWELKVENIAPIIKWEMLNKVYGNPKQKYVFYVLLRSTG